MTASCIISLGSCSVDLTNKDLEIAYRHSNPIITIDTPGNSTDAVGNNTIAINIGFVSNSYDLTFTLTDGPGAYSINPNGTNYEKLLYLASQTNPKTVTLVGTSTISPIPHGQIESLNVSWKSGMKDIAVGCTMSIKLCANITMS